MHTTGKIEDRVFGMSDRLLPLPLVTRESREYDLLSVSVEGAEVAYAQQGTTANAISPPTATAGLSFPLPIFYQQKGEIRRAEADLKTQSLQAAKLEAQVASDVQTGFSDYTSAASLARRMETTLLERARRARDLVSVQYQKGAASLLDFLDAQRTFNATNAEYLQDLALYWGAVFKLEQAVGEELR